jgi:F420-non-reducing hydrogenase large subunit
MISLDDAMNLQKPVPPGNGIECRCPHLSLTSNNKAAISMTIKKAAQGLIKGGKEISEGLLNKIEMAFRAYDPCMACATHLLPGQMPLEVKIYDSQRNLVNVLKKDIN